jgi:PleD family two-component response regulator
VKELLRRADAALHDAKRLGKDHVPGPLES